MILCAAGAVNPGEVILSTGWILSQDKQTIIKTIMKMAALSTNEFFKDTHCGDGRFFNSEAEFLAAYEEHKISEATIKNRRELTKLRRAEFSGVRCHIEIQIIERDGYVCKHSGCGQTEYLTVDHIVPISKGGSDDIANLQFLCRPHNSSKGDRTHLANLQARPKR